MEQISLSEYDIERVASQALGVAGEIDLGPAPEGGRYYLNLGVGLADVLDDDELREAVKEAVHRFFLERRAALRSELARRLRENRRWIQNESADSKPKATKARRTTKAA